MWLRLVELYRATPRWVLLLVAVLVAVGIGVVVGRCSSTPAPSVVVVDTRIDAGPGEAAIELERRAEVEQIEAELRQVEAENREALESFDADQREKYETVRRQGPEEVARWLSDFNRQLRESRR